MKKFYSQFFIKGDLVFDIGANKGEYTSMFHRLGAAVVAVEPNPLCCETLSKLERLKNIHVEKVAAGHAAGSAKLRLCDQSNLSTLSDDWFLSSREAPTYRNVKWLDQIEVPLTTLDLLSKRYGIPVFVKIDVEGYEKNVIDGMSFAPKFISFEFSNVEREGAVQCIERLGGKGYEFNPMLSRDFEFQFRDWKTDRETVDWLREYSGNEEFGDIFARLRS